MSQPHEVRDPVQRQQFYAAIGGMVAIAFVMVLGGLWLIAQLTGTGHDSLPQWVRSWVDGRPAWSAAATALALAVLAVLAVLLVVVDRKSGGLTTRYLEWKKLHDVDLLARRLSSRSDEVELREPACVGFARRVRLPDDYSPGIKLGYGVAFSQPLHMTYELTALMIVGPRMGKTTSVCVPMLVDWAGPAVGCTNKRDLHDLVTGPRSTRGKVWVNDIQQIAQQPPTWYWDCLSFILMGDDKASRASRLAGAWQACNASRTASTDAYFGPGGNSLLASLLLTAALEGLPVTAALEYLADLSGREPGIPDPVEVLRRHGYAEMATKLDADRSLNARQLDGLVGTANGVLSFLKEPSMLAWITPDASRRAFDPAEFVRSNDTLLMLSQKEEQGSGRAIVTALTMAVADAGVMLARQSPGGRLTRPLLLMLDEAANICPWPELPDKYSYLGSHGIVVVTVLQNRSQGVQAWGEDGMEQLVSSASVMLVGGGINSTKHLRELSELIGQREDMTASTSTGRAWSSRSVSRQVRRVDAISPARLRSWPRGRFIAFTAGARPIIIRSQPWYQGPHREVIAASERFFGEQQAEQEAVVG